MAANMPKFAAHQEASLAKLSKHGFLSRIDWDPIVSKVQSSYTGYLRGFLNNLSKSTGSIISMAASVVITLITAPIILFFTC